MGRSSEINTRDPADYLFDMLVRDHGVPFDKDADWVCHELAGHLQDVMRQCGGQKDDLSGWRQVAIHVIDLLLETYGKQWIVYATTKQ